MANDEIFSDSIQRGSRTYFFDINENKNGGLYLKISESNKRKSGFVHHRLIVFEEDVHEFFDELQKSIVHFKALKAFKKKANEATRIKKTS